MNFSLADLQLFTGVHRPALNTAPIHALGLYCNPPTHPETHNCVMITLKHDSAHVTEPGRRFSFVDAYVKPFSELMMEQPRYHGIEENRRMFNKQAENIEQFPHTVMVLLSCEGNTNIMPFVTFREEIEACKSQPLSPDWQGWLPKQISSGVSL